MARAGTPTEAISSETYAGTTLLAALRTPDDRQTVRSFLETRLEFKSEALSPQVYVSFRADVCTKRAQGQIDLICLQDTRSYATVGGSLINALTALVYCNHT